jgi:hypothetical protein
MREYPSNHCFELQAGEGPWRGGVNRIFRELLEKLLKLRELLRSKVFGKIGRKSSIAIVRGGLDKVGHL